MRKSKSLEIGLGLLRLFTDGASLLVVNESKLVEQRQVGVCSFEQNPGVSNRPAEPVGYHAIASQSNRTQAMTTE